MNESLILSLGDVYADIPRAIEGKDFPEQLDILRNEFGLEISPYTEENSATETSMGIQFRGVESAGKQGVFVKDIGLLSFEGEYLVEAIGLVGGGFTPKISISDTGIDFIEDGEQEKYQGFIKHESGKCKLYLFDGKNPILKKFSSEGRDEFDSPRVLQQVFLTAGQLGEIASV